MRRYRERPIERDPVTGRAKEPPPDTIKAERRQFIALQCLHAMQHGRSRYDRQVMRHAEIDWNRRQRAEKRRQSRTTSLELLIAEPVTEPDPIEAFDKLELAMHLLTRLPERERTIVSSMFFAGCSRSDIARALGITNKTVDELRRNAIKRLQEPS